MHLCVQKEPVSTQGGGAGGFWEGRGFTYSLVEGDGEGGRKQSWGRQRRGRERLPPPPHGGVLRRRGEEAFPPPAWVL